MPRLEELLQGVDGARYERGDGDFAVTEVRDDSRAVGEGDLFVAVPGAKEDGRRFVADALAKGATAIVTEGDGPVEDRAGAWVTVPRVRTALGIIAKNRFHAADALQLTAITGTNGKTTMTYLVDSILDAAGRRPGVVGTIAYRYAGTVVPAPNTTPGALLLHGVLAEMKKAGVTDVVMETTSHALEQGRVAGCRFRVAALTNVTQDHLDYHGTMEAYFEAKAILFRELLAPNGVAVLFADRDDGVRMREAVRGGVITVSAEANPGADVSVESKRFTEEGTTAVLATPFGRMELVSSLVGGFNLDNLVLAVGVGLAHGLSCEVIAAGIAELSGVPGRLERVSNDEGVLCVVDYAHTPDAIERAIEAVRPVTKGRLFVVFGCGGDRDATKRPLMGEAAARLGDIAVVTSDNPRTEHPDAIISMVVDGAARAGTPELDVASLATAEKGFFVETDRRTAIRQAIAATRRGDTVLIAGKGHEDYQILGTKKIHFDDREEAAAAFVAVPERP